MFRSLLAKRKQFVPDNPFFFLRNREGFRRLGKTRYMFTLTRFSELYYNTVYTKKYECQFYLLLLLFVCFFFYTNLKIS